MQNLQGTVGSKPQLMGPCSKGSLQLAWGREEHGLPSFQSRGPAQSHLFLTEQRPTETTEPSSQLCQTWTETPLAEVVAEAVPWLAAEISGSGRTWKLWDCTFWWYWTGLLWWHWALWLYSSSLGARLPPGRCCWVPVPVTAHAVKD